MITIYHNPRCSKSRQGLGILEESGKDFEIIKYLDDPLSEKDLAILIKKLEIAPIDLVRTNEAIWKEKYKGKQLTDDEIIKAMMNYPKLIERPIIVSEKGAVIGRPPENIQSIL
ncbi:arsenate reductase (glutaredoxin) [Dokdonia sinensis]|uniref:Arsenate reductase (Glutaredoxin) n=1 Tax=Dokdonia sinensis TaxID=2479847 RepID=A0A3M0GHE9_9FLAO|nr:arsenate reductase (glutaredoxin) [Dokdonia sinensis]RMB61013.1 arsenate reductase (glutaredoxin) [Dokdonia sinensis]